MTAPTLPDGTLGGSSARRWTPDPRWRLVAPALGVRPPGIARQPRGTGSQRDRGDQRRPDRQRGLGELARPNLPAPRPSGPSGDPQRSPRAAVVSSGPDSGPFAGQSTAAQMRALRHLEYIAGIQRTAASAPSGEEGRRALAGLWGARRRLATFAVNGLIVFIVGLALQYALIKFLHLSHVVSYVIQTVFSVQLNFALSRLLTWRDRAVSFAGALVRFNLQQLAAAALAMALYAGLDRLGMHFPVSNLVVTALLAPVTFIVGHRWSMAERAERPGRPDRRGQYYAMQLGAARRLIANHLSRELPAHGEKLTSTKRRITFGSTIGEDPPAVGTVAAHTSVLNTL